jgi:hypothetical protein
VGEELRELFKDGLITLHRQPGGFYVASSAVLPLVLITKTPPELASGGVSPGTQSLVARGRNYTWTTGFTVPIEVWVA